MNAVVDRSPQTHRSSAVGTMCEYRGHGRRSRSFRTTITVPDRSHRLIRRNYPLPPFCMANAKESAAAPSSVKPAKVFRRRGIAVSVFANTTEVDGRRVSYHKVTIQRTYRDGLAFKTTTSFGRDDLPLLRLLIGQAWMFIIDAEYSGGGE